MDDDRFPKSIGDQSIENILKSANVSLRNSDVYMVSEGDTFDIGDSLPMAIKAKELRTLNLTAPVVFVDKDVYAYISFKIKYLWDLIVNKEMCYVYYVHFGSMRYMEEDIQFYFENKDPSEEVDNHIEQCVGKSSCGILDGELTYYPAVCEYYFNKNVFTHQEIKQGKKADYLIMKRML